MNIELTPRQKVVLAALAADPGAKFAPVQVQKMFFLMDENIAKEFGRKHFNFEPYDYGPFDKSVYDELESLSRLGLVAVENPESRAQRRYALSIEGQDLGAEALGSFSEKASEYVAQLSKWVRSLSFAELVGAVYRAYPRMKENSIFSG